MKIINPEGVANLETAFDCISLQRLRKKLHIYPIKGLLNRFALSYVTKGINEIYPPTGGIIT